MQLGLIPALAAYLEIPYTPKPKKVKAAKAQVPTVVQVAAEPVIVERIVYVDREVIREEEVVRVVNPLYGGDALLSEFLKPEYLHKSNELSTFSTMSNNSWMGQDYRVR